MAEFTAVDFLCMASDTAVEHNYLLLWDHWCSCLCACNEVTRPLPPEYNIPCICDIQAQVLSVTIDVAINLIHPLITD